MAASRIYRSVNLLDELYAAHNLPPSERAFELTLQMAERLRRPELAAEVLQRMVAAGHTPSAEQSALPETLAVPLVRDLHPKLKQRTWSSRRGFYEPTLREETKERWRLVTPPRLGGAERDVEAIEAAARRKAEITDAVYARHGIDARESTRLPRGGSGQGQLLESGGKGHEVEEADEYEEYYYEYDGDGHRKVH